WFAYSASVELDPGNVNPSTMACHLHIVNFDGSGDIDLTPDSTDCAAAPAISPDAKWIATLSGYARTMGAGMASSLHVVSINGAQSRVFSPSPLSTGGIRWSKDGTKLAYLYRGDSRWYVLDAQTGAPITALDALNAADWLLPNLSPDGQYRATYC